jgi:cellulose biosynthesis protein BcsQ
MTERRPRPAAAVPAPPLPPPPPKIVTVASDKGGVGKSTLAVELAYALGAVLVDLDHASGSATACWPEPGVLAPEYARRALLAGDGPGPRVIRREGWPDFIPAHPDYGAVANLDPAVLAERLEAWAVALGRTLVVDCHPGWTDLSLAGASAAHLVVVPVPLEERSLRAFAGFARTAVDYPIAAVPSRVPRWGDYPLTRVAPLHARLVEVATGVGASVGPMISDWREWPQRQSLRPLLANTDPGLWVGMAQGELRALTEWVGERL